MTAWPEFHNGVAAGIRLAPGGGGLTRTWVVYNKPKTPNYTHAGMLMGLGLAGAQHTSDFFTVDVWSVLNSIVGVGSVLSPGRRTSLITLMTICKSSAWSDTAVVSGPSKECAWLFCVSFPQLVNLSSHDNKVGFEQSDGFGNCDLKIW